MIRLPTRSGALASLLVFGTGFLPLLPLGAPAANAQAPAASPSSPAAEVVHTDSQGRHLAPHDTFYVLSYVSATTTDGVEGFPPGKEVRLVSVDHQKHLLTVTDGRAQVEVPPTKLTNDLDIAEMVKEKDEAKQARITAYMQAEAQAYEKYERAEAAYTATDLEHREQAQATEVRAEQATPAPQVSQPAQPVDASVGANGYYGYGGYGYGSPYSYFIGNTGALSSRTGTQAQAGSAGGGSKEAAPAARPAGGVTGGGGRPK